MNGTYLVTAYADKDQVKALGARWDPARRQWYVPTGRDITPFISWLPKGAEIPASGDALAPANSPPRQGNELAIPQKGITLTRLLAGVAQAISEAFKTGVWTLVEVVDTGAVAGGLSSAIQAGSGKAFWRGALTGALFAGAGQVGAANSPAIYAAHAGAGCVSSVAGGGKCGQGALSGLFGKFASNNFGGPLVAESTSGDIASKAIASALAGCVGASLGGGKFSDGPLTGAIGYAANGLVGWMEKVLDGQDVHSHWKQTIRFAGPGWGADDWGPNNEFGPGHPDAYNVNTRSVWELKSSGCLMNNACRMGAEDQLRGYTESATNRSGGRVWMGGNARDIAGMMTVQGSRGTYALTYHGGGLVGYDKIATSQGVPYSVAPPVFFGRGRRGLGSHPTIPAF